MPSVVVTLLVVLVTLMLAIGVFGLYNSYFSTQGSTIAGNEIVVSQSKQTEIFVSPITFKGIGPSYTYFNVSFLLWYSAPVKNVVLVPFVVNPLPGLGTYLYSPQGNPNATILMNYSGGLKILPHFTLNSPVYTPQGQQLKSGVPAYNASSTGTYIVHFVVKPGQIVVVWVLTHEFGKWYRLGYFFVNPADAGLGLYVVTHTGNYLGNSKQVNFQAPHLFTNNQGVQTGLWFEPLGNATTNSTIFYATLNTTNNNFYYLKIYQSGYNIYVSSNYSKSNGNPQLLGSVSPFNWYFLNFTYGHQTGNNVILFSDTGKIIGSVAFPIGQTNGYELKISFGSNSFTDAISQAFLVTKQSNSPGTDTSFYNVSTTMLTHGPYYNNTMAYNWTINHAQQSLNGIVYWNFVYPSSSPPAILSAIVWYWPSGSGHYKYASITYLMESGPNTWIIG
ncbi:MULTISPECIES: hypothetical protein [Metallosphaera]|uniref:Uncharacterized protein n=1 Tax=Metallosphaera prunae TaxID=47304 RepID=A0A4D8S103_METPR|nr:MULTISPECIES: hypothetical protein [Metallosphaera]MCY0862869.1 hypothetical protein [Metallosphaera prunae]QCO30787.1 hypothetical protein DFR88_10070 [Metallosphaera prunae]BBL47760.1 hypothetical protein MJ1HA_1866 [Metallosphaera sedula]